MKTILSTEEALNRLAHLCQVSHIQDVEFKNYIEQLAAENEQLKLNLHKLRTTIAKR